MGEGLFGFTLVELLVVIALIALLIALLLPTLSRAKQQAASVACLSNLRQMAAAAQMYCDANRGSFPIAQYTAVNLPLVSSMQWDFITIRNTTTGEITVAPGLLWAGHTNPRIQQCPSYDGKSNSIADPFTGYNYNTSYIGHGEGETIPAPIKISQVRSSSRCALFGDGQYSAGANKFMRAPFPNPGDASFIFRVAGTQGFRHAGRTNVAFVDGHADSLSVRYITMQAAPTAGPAPGTGFLSPDNSLYDPGQ